MGLPLQQYPEAFPSPPATAPPPSWLPQPPPAEQAPAAEQAPPPTEYPSQPRKKSKAPPPGGGGPTINGIQVRGWQILLVGGVALALWTLLQVSTFTGTTAAWNEFDQAPSCAPGTVADGCKASMSLLLAVERSSPNSGCVIFAYPKKGGPHSYRGSFSKDTCNGVQTNYPLGGIIWQGSLVEVSGTSPWAPCVGNTPYFAPHACVGAWSDDSRIGQHWSALDSMLKAFLFDAAFAPIALLYVIAKAVGWVRRRI